MILIRNSHIDPSLHIRAIIVVKGESMNGTSYSIYGSFERTVVKKTVKIDAQESTLPPEQRTIPQIDCCNVQTAPCETLFPNLKIWFERQKFSSNKAIVAVYIRILKASKLSYFSRNIEMGILIFFFPRGYQPLLLQFRNRSFLRT